MFKIINENYRGGNRVSRKANVAGFSMIELVVSMALTLIILGIAVLAFSSALGSRDRESSRTDALTSAQAALNIMSREIGNAGYGLVDNGIVAADSNDKRLHFRTNEQNTGTSSGATDQPGEDVTFYFDSDSHSVVRFDRVTGTSGIINRVSDVDFVYYNYTYDPATHTVNVVAGPAGVNTSRVNITLKVILANVQGQPANRIETITSDVTLRNSTYMLGQY